MEAVPVKIVPRDFGETRRRDWWWLEPMIDPNTGAQMTAGASSTPLFSLHRRQRLLAVGTPVVAGLLISRLLGRVQTQARDLGESEQRTRLLLDNPGSWFGPFAAAVNTLRTGLVPAPLRQSLYGALLGLPHVTLVEDVPNLDGRACTAIVHDAGRTRTELLIHPADGQFAGERDTLRTESRCGLPSGTVISATAVVTANVDVIGESPAA